MKLGRHLGNIYDHRKPDAERRMPHSFQAMNRGHEAMRQEWLRHLEWIRANVIGPPKATDSIMVKRLEDMGYIGIYAKAED